MNEKELIEAIRKRSRAVGARATLRMAKVGKVKAAIVASNCPLQMKKKLRDSSVELVKFRGSSRELGVACGKPFNVVVLGLE